LIIIEAIRRARTEHVVYFLLSAWLETLVHTGRARALPEDAVRLPVREGREVPHRLHLIRERLACEKDIAPQRARVLEDAARAFAVAREKLRDLRVRAAYRRQRSRAGGGSYVGWRLTRGT
jgi:hypothetical protein